MAWKWSKKSWRRFNDALELENHARAVKNNKKLAMSKRIRKVLVKNNGKCGSVEDLARIANLKRYYARAITKRIEMHKNRVDYKKQNGLFEFKRKLFDRNSPEQWQYDCKQSEEDMLQFWSKAWDKQQGVKDALNILDEVMGKMRLQWQYRKFNRTKCNTKANWNPL